MESVAWLESGGDSLSSASSALQDIIGVVLVPPIGPVLFLIDEVFSGTNSRDRRIAAESVIRSLVTHGAVGAISTHDLALTEIVWDAAPGGVNMHMESRNSHDPLDFDYRIKEGVSQRSNALAIVEMMGI
jgi:DNA mismatch repair ATPase MutS